MKNYKYKEYSPLRVLTSDGSYKDIYAGFIVSGPYDNKEEYRTSNGVRLKLTEKDLSYFDVFYSKEELEHWKALREQAAIAALQVIDIDFVNPDESAEKAVRLANALIKKLQETE